MYDCYDFDTTEKELFFFVFLLLLCFSEFASYQSLKFESISVEAFTFGKDQYVVFPQPFAGTCSFLEWDHVEMTFRPFETIESEKKTKVTVLTLWILCFLEGVEGKLLL